MPTYDGEPYPTTNTMLEGIARKWLDERGRVGSKRTPTLAAECAADWGLASHMDAEGYDTDDLARAFAIVLAQGGDRRSERRGAPVVTEVRGGDASKGARARR